MTVKNKMTEASVKKKTQKVVIEEYNDGFSVIVDEKCFHFDQEDYVVGLVSAFRAVGCDDVEYKLELCIKME